MKHEKPAEGFSSGLAIFFATLGSALGLGNIWKFPYLTGSNGGAAFLFTYILCVFFVGIPVMISEFYMGRKTRKNIIGAVKTLKPNNPLWKVIGILSILACYMIMFFYTDVAGWVYSYVFKSLTGQFNGITTESAVNMFKDASIGPMSPIIWQFIVLVIVSVILIAGVQKGIEKVTKTLIPLLFVLIILCDIRSLTLPGTAKGLEFLFKPDFSQLTGAAVLTALGLAFFKLGVGLGTMTTYSSYFTEDNNMPATAFKVAFSDTFVSILAGIAIFPAVFTFNIAPSSGPGLLFMTIPVVFSKIPFGGVLLAVFFSLTAIVATTAMISILEVPVAYMVQEWKMSRKKATIINASLIFIIGLSATLSVDPTSILGGIKVPGFNLGLFDFFDFISQNIMLPLGGLLIIILVGYFIPKQEVFRELSNNAHSHDIWYLNIYWFIVRYIAPALIIYVFLSYSKILDLIINLFK